MPRFAVIGDVHAHHRHLDRVLDRLRTETLDAILLVGDLGRGLGKLKARTPARVERYRGTVRAVLAKVRALGSPVFYVPGNHDLPGLEEEGNLDGRAADVAGLVVAGIGGAGPKRFGFAYEWGEDDIRQRQLPPADVLLVHCPPRGTRLDKALWLFHVGSRAIRERALASTGFLVCGHIHESTGAEQLGACLCLNVGGLGAPFGRPQVGFLERRDGRDEVWHEDLKKGRSRSWVRQS